jgi:CheY-like chemotaxis protein
MLREILVDCGQVVIEARNGWEGLERFLHAQADLVITDLVMPGMGLEVVTTLRKQQPSVNIIASDGEPAPPEGVGVDYAPTHAWTWPALMHRVFALDVHACPRCGGRLRVIATVQDPLVVQAILAHLRRSGAPSRLALPYPPRPQSGRLLARSGPRSLTLAPLHPRLDREPVAAQDHWGPAGALDADPRLRPLDRALPGPPPGLTGEAGLPRRRPPRGGGVNRSYAPRN